VTEPIWITRAAAVALQEMLLSSFGGVPGMRDEAALQAALARPPKRFHAGQSSIFGLAASYSRSLMKDRPFVDGNKRLGFTASVVFLELNGYQFRAPEADAALRTLAFAAAAMDEADYAAWLEAHSRKP
jgi:death-on-curing protein